MRQTRERPMKPTYTAAQYVWWLAVAAGQSVVLRKAWSSRDVRFYLCGELLLTSVGLPLTLFAPRTWLVPLYLTAEWTDNVLTVALLFSLLERLRVRARRRYASPVLTAGLGAFALGVTMLLAKLPIPQLSQNVLGPVHTMSHTIWSWLCLTVVLAPVYCFVSGANFDRRTLLLFVGLSLYIAVHAGVLTFLILQFFNHSAWADLLSNVTYLLTLCLWYAGFARPVVPAAYPREPRP